MNGSKQEVNTKKASTPYFNRSNLLGDIKPFGNEAIVVYEIKDFTLSWEYAEQKQQQGYIINAFVFNR